MRPFSTPTSHLWQHTDAENTAFILTDKNMKRFHLGLLQNNAMWPIFFSPVAAS
jgi:hypothetical protein